MLIRLLKSFFYSLPAIPFDKLVSVVIMIEKHTLSIYFLNKYYS